MVWWRKNPNKRIDNLLVPLKELELLVWKLRDKIDLIELKIANALIKKKLKEAGSLDEKVTEKSISPDGLDCIRNMN